MVPAVTEANLYVSTRPDCDFSRDTFTACPGQKHQITADVVTRISHFGGESLKKGQAYFLRLETVFANGAKGLSNLASARPNELAFDGTVRAITAAPDGTVYLGGDFTSVGVATGSAVPLVPSTGDLANPIFPTVAGTVNAIVDDGAGGWYLAGQFTHVGGLSHRNLTHVLPNGSVDTDWRMFPDGPVYALEHLGRVLYVGGAFNNIGDLARRNIAAIRDGRELYTWNPSPNNTVRALERFGNTLYIGGDFTAGSGKPGFLAAFELQDQQQPLSDQPLPINMNLDGPVRALAADGNRALYVGGSFTWFGNAARLNLGKLVIGGPTPAPIAADFQPNPGIGDSSSSVNALVADRFGRVYIGGSFAHIVGQGAIASRTNLAAVFESGELNPNWKPNPNSTVESIAEEFDGSAIYVGGGFNIIGSGSDRLVRKKIAKVDPVFGAAIPTFRSDPGATVRALVLAGGTIYAGGDFKFVDGEVRVHLASIGADGSLQPWNPDVNGTINALVFHNNRFHGPVVYAGGSFSSIRGRPKPNLAALDASSGGVSESNFVGTANGPVNALAILESSEALYVAGDFTSIANSPVSNLAKLFLFNGTANLDFKPQPTGPINALIATTDAVSGKDVVYAGGAFKSIRKNSSTPSRFNLAKLDADSGTALDEFVVNPNGPVTTLALSSDPHAIYIGGNFDRINGALMGAPGVGGLAAVEIDGSPLLTGCSTCFNPGPDGGRPQSLATFSLGFGERVFVGGSFPNIGGGPISNFAALTGYSFGAPTGFSSGAFVFPNGPVSALAVSGNKIYIGGEFSGFNGSVNGSFGGEARGNFGVVDATTGELIH
jgi:hypothetical protein